MSNEKYTTRREFIRNGLTYLSLSVAMPHFLIRAAQAAPDLISPSQLNNRILIVIELSGGNDGLNTVIPYSDPAYKIARPGLQINESEIVKIDKSLGLHPRMKPLGDLYQKGHLAVVNGVGYPNPNRSHFHSMDIWQTGDPNVDFHERTGWIARYFNADGHLKSNPLSGVTVGSALPLLLFAEQTPVSVVNNGNDYGFHIDGNDRDRQIEALKGLYADGTVAGDNAEFIRRIGSGAYTSSEEIKKAVQAYDEHYIENSLPYPRYNGFADGLHTIAKLISGGVSTRVYYLNLGGFDTHANQPWQHGALLGTLSESISAFFQDLEKHGRQDDVIVMTFSEFGRRVKENGSYGTDHGAASVLFIAGNKVKGGVYGDYPSLTDLDDGDLRFHTDFRSIYATLLEDWLGTGSTGILGGSYSKLGLV